MQKKGFVTFRIPASLDAEFTAITVHKAHRNSDGGSLDRGLAAGG